MVKTNRLDKTILYPTDHSLDPHLFDVCQRWLVKQSCGCPIVSVSQKPMDFGTNVCVGDIGRSGISLDIQLLEGLKTIKTKWVMVAEHDCIYGEEHIRWIPPNDIDFFYNDNVWLVQYSHPLNRDSFRGMFSHYRKRRVQSQLICSTQRYLEAMTLKVKIVTSPEWRMVYPSGRLGEPGHCDPRRTRRLIRRHQVAGMSDLVMKYLYDYKAVDFLTEVPNIDIRHKSNYTGTRRGNHRRMELQHWGTLDEVINA